MAHSSGHCPTYLLVFPQACLWQGLCIFFPYFELRRNAMVCSRCNTTQDSDSRFCSECGAALAEPRKSRSAYRYALLLIPVIVIACAIGYYKFILPQGIAAVVNGEEITHAELEQELLRIEGSRRSADPGVRYQALNGLIAERIMLHEARKAGTDVSREEL